MRSRVISSSAPNGSSINNSSWCRCQGAGNRTRCCIPPDNCLRPMVLKAAQSDHLQQIRAPLLPLSLVEAVFQAAARHCAEWCASRTIQVAERPYHNRGQVGPGAPSLPLTVTVPADGAIKPPTRRSKVDLPQPDGPMMEPNSLAECRLIDLSATVSSAPPRLKICRRCRMR